jgi:hypothetical protein
MPKLNTVPNQKQLRQAMLQLFTQPEPAQRSPLTPTQRFIVSDLKDLIMKRDGKGKDTFEHWELRKLKDTRAVLLVSLIGKQERYIIIGPRGHLTQLTGKESLAEMALDEAIQEQFLGTA